MSALDKQEGGNHYKDMAIQPVEFIHKNGLGFIVGNIIKYVCRYQNKTGAGDLKKARHYLDMLIEMETTHTAASDLASMGMAGGAVNSKAANRALNERVKREF